MKSLNPQNSSRDLNIKVSEAANAATLGEAVARWPQSECGFPTPQTHRKIPEALNSDSVEDSYPLSPMQQGMLFHSLYARNPGVNIEQVIYSLHEPLDAHAFMRAWQQVVDRHAILRSSFRWEGVDEPLQEVHSRAALEWRSEDWSGLPEVERKRRIEAYLSEDRLRGFSLKEDSLTRMALFRTGEADFEFIWTFHHAIVDGRSLVIIFNEVFAYYEAFRNGRALNLPLPPPYRTYIDWLQRQDSLKAEAFWRRMLDGFASPTPLVIANELDGVPDREPQYEEQEITLGAELTSALRSLAQENGITFNTLVQGAWALLLSRYSGEEDVVFGATRRCRRSSVSDADSIVGLFINTLPMRVSVREDMRLLPWLKGIRAQHVAFREYEHTPLAKIQEWSQVANGTSLFDSILIFENYELNSYLQSQGRDWANRDFEIREQPTYSLELSAWAGAELLLRMAYDSGRFDGCAIARMLGHLKNSLASMVENPDADLYSLEMLGEQERRRLLVEWNDTRKPHSARECIHHLFEAQAGRTPEATALLYGQERLSYGQLNERANQLAHHLRTLGVGPDMLVAVCMERSPDLIAGLLATLKAGGAYVPLDPAHPKERLAVMLADARPAVVLAHRRTVGNLPPTAAPLVCLDSERGRIEEMSKDNPGFSMAARNLAYVIYTSGSTGSPKGVMVEHRSVVNYINYAATEFAIEPGDRVLQFASVSFDTSAEEIYPCLTRGATLVLRDENTLASTSALLAQCSAQAITVLDLPTAYWHELTERVCAEGLELPPSLRLVIIGGESALPERLAMWQRHVGSRVRLINTYGPTEATIVSTACDLTPGREQGQNPSLRKAPIGRPVNNVQVYVLDRRHRLLPSGVPGELHVGGDAVARGYLNRPEMTAEKFIPNPFSSDEGSRLYSTGDLARHLPDGNIQFCGRSDNQVKVRGFRIELGDIEAALSRSPIVAGAAVSMREGVQGDKQLVAYIVPAAGSHPADHSTMSARLRAFLKSKLPHYMIPSAFVTVDALPLNGSGKLDRKALPDPVGTDRSRNSTYVRPRDPLEYHLVQIWEELFDQHPIGITDNFFSLGGHSLLSIRMIDRIEQAFGLRLPLATLFAAATIEYLAEALLKQESEFGRSHIVAVQPNGSKRPFFYLHGDFNGGGLYCLNLARYLGQDQPFYALQPHGIDGDEIPPTIEAMAKDHVETLRDFQPEGPYLLGGHCNGGLIAFEMAQQLKAQGQEVDLLAIICAAGTNARFRALRKLVNGYCSLRGLDIGEQQERFLRCLRVLEHLSKGRSYYGERLNELSKLNFRDRAAVIGKSAPKVMKKVGNLILGRAAEWPDAQNTDGSDDEMSLAENRRQNVMNAYVKAMTGYVPSPYNGRISLLWPAESPFEPSDDPTWGWGDVAAQVDVRTVPGGHLTCIIDHAKDLAGHLRECLAKASLSDCQ